MSFYGSSFTFDGIPCEEYGLIIYDFGSSSQSNNGAFTSSGNVIEDRTPHRYKPFYYGVQQNKPVEFTLVFGVNSKLAEKDKHLDRWDLESIASWLTGKDGYKWLEIEQPDMQTIRYRCIITELKYLTAGWLPWAFECRVSCDSPFAYTFPETFVYRSTSTLQIPFYNRSTYNGFYYPEMRVSLLGGTSISIVNHSDNDREFLFAGLPNNTSLVIDIDNENCVITNNLGVNMYQYFNFNFFRLARGDNRLFVTGNCRIELSCEFPVIIGG